MPEALGKVGEFLTDAGYFSEADVATCVEAGIDPLIAVGVSRVVVGDDGLEHPSDGGAEGLKTG